MTKSLQLHCLKHQHQQLESPYCLSRLAGSAATNTVSAGTCGYCAAAVRQGGPQDRVG